MKTLFVLAIILLTAAGCDGTEETAAVTQLPVATAATSTPVGVEEITGPVVTLWPATSGVSVGGGRFGLSTDGTITFEPAGYKLPARIFIYKIESVTERYTLILGSAPLPANHKIRVPLQEEIRIGPLEKGTTQVIFE